MLPNQTILETIVENMKTSLRMVKGMESADKLAAKRVALHMVANNAGIQQYNDRRVAKALGIQPRNLKKHRADIQAKTFKWVGEGRKSRADCLSEVVVHSVIQFWTSNTSVSPNKKDVCRQRISQKNYRFHPTHYLKLTEPWKLHKLEPDREENNAVVVEQDDIVYSEQQEELADMLKVGDNLAVLKSPTNIDNEDYYIVLCKEAKRVLSEQVKDGWGNVFNIGDTVVHGIYYAKLPQCKNSYALLREAPTAMLHVDAIVAIKFPMLQAKHKVKGYITTYHVPLKVHECILGNVTLLNS
ncbi:hypothetical protein L7F22_012147 [Adiantum nelumboides]|nr:hypothetical protein [Adiantum nelumboides]